MLLHLMKYPVFWHGFMSVGVSEGICV